MSTKLCSRGWIFGLVVSAGSAMLDVAVAANVDTVPGKITLQAEYFDKDSNLLNDPSLPRIVLFRMPVIAGNISGGVTSSDLIQLKIKVGMPTILDLGDLITAVTSLAAPLTKEAAAAGLVVTPKETRFARFATLVANPETGKGVGGARFETTEVDQTILLVYFDRPCQLSGVVRDRDNSIYFDVRVTSRGMHLLLVARDGQSNARVTHAAVPSVFILGITPRK
jgi:hypothetical protein